jgi:hypothetical protein
MASTTGSSETNPESNLSSEGTPQSGTQSTTAGMSPTKTFRYDSWSEPASRQAMDAGIGTLRTHVDDCISSINDRLTATDELNKSKLETVEAKLNGEMNILKSNVQTLLDERKTKKDRGWDIRAIIISNIISLIAGAGLTLVIEKWLIK